MRKVIYLLLLLTSLNVQAGDGKGNFAVWGVGNKSCFHYSQARGDSNDADYRGYIMGFLTAFNKLTPETFSISDKMTIDEILAWLDNYCEMKQVEGFQNALDEYINTHYEKRLKQPPNTTNTW